MGLRSWWLECCPLLPDDFRVSPAWVYPSFLAVLLIVLVVGDPGRIDRQRPWLQVTTGLMVGLIAVANGIAAGRLVSGILSDAEFDNPTQLLLIGAVVWVTNVLAFALWFWNVDSGGALPAQLVRWRGRRFVSRMAVASTSRRRRIRLSRTA